MVQELTTTAKVKFPDGTIKRVEDLTTDELKQWRENARQRLSKSMSLYFSQHRDEYAKI